MVVAESLAENESTPTRILNKYMCYNFPGIKIETALRAFSKNRILKPTKIKDLERKCGQKTPRRAIAQTSTSKTI